MTDPFTDVADDLMTRSTDLGGADPAPAPPATNAKTKKHVCPYCGAVTAVVEKPSGACPRCNMEDTPATRAATKARIGPWYVLQTRNPSAPGMKWATLLSLVSKGQVTPRSVVRGPTTHQLWKFAAHVKGLSREFNLCYSCGGEIERTANQCPHCDRLQEPPVNPDSLLESRDLGPRVPVQREIKPPASIPMPTDLVLAGGQNEPLARPRTPDDGILSAKELAAAFQLDFNPTPPTSNDPAEPRRKRRPARALAMLILLAVIACGGVLFARPDYRDKTVAWVSTTFASIKNSVSPAKPAPKSMPWDNQTAEQKPDDSASPTPAGSTQEPAPAPSPTPAPVVDQTPAPTTPPPPANPTPAVVTQAPKPAPEPTAVAIADPPPVVESKPTPPPAPAPMPVAQASTPNAANDQLQQQQKLSHDLDAPVPQSIDEQKELGKRLRDAAFDAERIPDFRLEIRCWEKIEKELNESAWPMNKGTMDMYLKYANDQIKH